MANEDITMGIKRGVFTGLAVSALVIFGTAVGYYAGKSVGRTEGAIAIYNAVSEKPIKDGDDTIIELSDEGRLRVLIKRDLSSGMADYSFLASCTRLSEGLELKNAMYVDTDSPIWDNSTQKEYPSQHDGLVDRIIPISYEGFFENRTDHSSYIRSLDFEENQPFFEEGDRLMEEMRNTLKQKVNIELMFM
ncbi:MAG: hypothetical protein AABX27_00285 [Nanoarchaeota archaeon]